MIKSIQILKVIVYLGGNAVCEFVMSDGFILKKSAASMEIYQIETDSAYTMSDGTMVVNKSPRPSNWVVNGMTKSKEEDCTAETNLDQKKYVLTRSIHRFPLTAVQQHDSVSEFYSIYSKNMLLEKYLNRQTSIDYIGLQNWTKDSQVYWLEGQYYKAHELDELNIDQGKLDFLKIVINEIEMDKKEFQKQTHLFADK